MFPEDAQAYLDQGIYPYHYWCFESDEETAEEHFYCCRDDLSTGEQTHEKCKLPDCTQAVLREELSVFRETGVLPNGYETV